MEYTRLDRSGEYTYQNMFAGPLNARAMLGKQVEAGNDGLVWSETHYVGTALTDAVIMIQLLTDDWGELQNSLVPSEMTSWTLGDYVWSDEVDTDIPDTLIYPD